MLAKLMTTALFLINSLIQGVMFEEAQAAKQVTKSQQSYSELVSLVSSCEQGA